MFIALIRYWTKLIFSSIILSDDKNAFNRHGRCRKKSRQQKPFLYIKLFTSNADPSESPFSWDTDGIPFIIDNSATAIISNECKFLYAPLVPTKVTLETAEGISTETKLFGHIRLVLINNSNHNYVYIVPGCVYNPDTPLNILGVPALGSFFGDSAYASDMLAADGTNINSGETKYISFGIMANTNGISYMDQSKCLNSFFMWEMDILCTRVQNAFKYPLTTYRKSSGI